ncbi:DNA replication factor A subunit Ssb3 [Schizosaccharomyces japonicus yFS275]|uniref:DNA replication factor A subunit Ssb3 n=1 Tax=Schizosaccharomyces japonicus (strain yFS275 / FY16936) TaxID=402676 RepID=B6K2S4_SCHJY|nr:DNA replication factor A subunit Ssb3 [Schizosaccharomyces japonicus yFS275]EEB08564.1 DNA replication factor A subunit Ssb3 [Schizosaccharomyces japonicus yFS275]
MDRPTPRINAKLLDQFVGRTVRVVGKVISVQGRSATIDSNGTVNMQLTMDNMLEPNHFYEFVSSVKPDLSLQLLTYVDFGTDIDMDIYDNVVELSQAHKSIFCE